MEVRKGKNANHGEVGVSVIVATYNSAVDKLIYTLDSIVIQKGIKTEIIITDDGSKEFDTDTVIQYFEQEGYTEYTILLHEENSGTVKNCYDGVLAASGKYVKPISPGDALSDEGVLSEWIEATEKSGKEWSFGEVKCYLPEDSNVYVEKACHPQLIGCYKKQNDKACIWNYLVIEDIVLGASVLCKSKCFERYLGRIVDKVIYAEDMAYRLMMYDGIVPFYYERDVVIYEYGSGISTSGNEVWYMRLNNDTEAVYDIMFSENDTSDKFKNTIKRINDQKKIINKKGIKKLLFDIFVKKELKYKFRWWFCLRKTHV